MATYNGTRFIKEQLESLSKQTVLPDELIIVDDASNDDTIKIIENFRKTVSFEIKVIVNTVNIGSTFNCAFGQVFSKGIEHTNSDIVFFADQDDYWFSNKLEMHLEIYRKTPQIGCIINDAILTDANLQDDGFTRFELWRMRRMSSKTNVLGCCTSIRKYFLNKIMPIPTFSSHDSIISHIMSFYDLRYELNKPLQYYRRHPNSITFLASDKMTYIKSINFDNVVKKPNVVELFCTIWFTRFFTLLTTSKLTYENELLTQKTTLSFGEKLIGNINMDDMLFKEKIKLKNIELQSKINLLEDEIKLTEDNIISRFKKVLFWLKIKRIPLTEWGILRALKDILYPLV